MIDGDPATHTKDMALDETDPVRTVAGDWMKRLSESASRPAFHLHARYSTAPAPASGCETSDEI